MKQKYLFRVLVAQGSKKVFIFQKKNENKMKKIAQKNCLEY